MRRSLRHPVIAGLWSAFLAAVSGLHAAQAQSAPFMPDRVVSALMENDVVAGTDRDYTNGLRLSVLARNGAQTGLSGVIGRRLLGARFQDTIYAGFTAGHMLFTPATYGRETPPPGQHPYAGFAFVEGETLRFGVGALERARLQLGLVGPSAGGEAVQTNWHTLTASEQPQGWDHQLRDEVTLGVSYDRTARTLAGPRFGRGAELLTAGGAALGTALTQAHVSVIARFGDGLRRDFGPPRVGAGAPGAAVFEPAPGLAWNIFAAGHARAVARNIALDGNTFADGPRVQREVLVFEAQTGLSLQRGAARTAVVITRRTREFATQSAGQIFGGLTVSRAF